MKALLARKVDELFGIDTRSLALMRIGVSLVVLYDLLFERLTNLSAHYGVGSIFPPSIVPYEWMPPWPQIFTLVAKFPSLPLVLILVGIVSTTLLLFGWKTRIASVVTWIAVFALQLLNPLILQGGDVLIRLMLFLGMFLPWGSTYSVDRALSFIEAPKRRLTAWTAAVLIQVAFIYFFAVSEKTGVEWTVEGTGVYYALAIDQFTTPIGEFTRQFPMVMMFLSFAVVTLQHTAPFLLFAPIFTVPIRTLAMALLMFMHFSFALHMNLGPFSWISISALTVFLPTRFWEFITAQSGRRFGNLTLYYDGECGFCKKSVYLARMFFLLPNTTILPAQSDPTIQAEMERHDSWVIVDRTGAHFFTYGAGVAILRASPLLFWIAPIFEMAFARPIGERVYRFIANHRRRVCIPDTPPRFTLPPLIVRSLLSLSTALGLIYIVAILAWDYSNLPTAKYHPVYPREYLQIMPKLSLDQRWNMFSPMPLKEDGWFLHVGTLANGTTINAFDPYTPLYYEKPPNVSALHPDERWRKYLMNLWASNFASMRKYHLDRLCREWNKEHDGGQRLVRIEFIYMLELTLPDNQTAPIQPTLMEARDCPSI